MKYSDIKVGNIYFVNLEPVRRYEFGGNHLGIVLKKGKDKRTVTIISLTSKSSGEGENKINIGVVPSLPTRLIQRKKGKQQTNSYVVLDQVRTVEVSRVEEVFDGKDANGNDKPIDCAVDLPIFNKINCELANSTISNIANDDEIWMYHKESFINFSVKKMINLTYAIIKDQKKANERTELKDLYNAIKAIKDDFSIEEHLNKNDLKNGVSDAFISIVSNNDKVNA